MNQIRKILTDMIPVILGILIALLINNWRDAQKDQRFLDRTFTSIQAELADNREGIEGVLESHNVFMDTLYLYLEDEEISILDVFLKTNGFKSAFVNTTTWQALIGSKVELVEYETLSKLFVITELKKLVEKKSNSMEQFVYGNMNENSYRKKEQLAIYLSDLMDSENQLLKAHIAYLEPAVEDKIENEEAETDSVTVAEE